MLTTIIQKPTYQQSEENLFDIKKVEIICNPTNLPESLHSLVKHFIKKKKQTVFVQSSPYLMATVMYECKMNNIQCKAYKLK